MAAPVLMVSYEAPPRLTAKSLMTLKTLRALVDADNTLVVDLVSASPVGEVPDDPLIEDALPDSLRMHRVDPVKAGRKTLFQRIIGGKGGWQHAAAEKCEALFPAEHKKPALIYSRSNPPASHLVVLELLEGSMAGVPWIAHFTDPWSQNLNYRSPATRAALSEFEKQVFARAQRLIFASTELLERMLEGTAPEIRAKALVLPPVGGSALPGPVSALAPLPPREPGRIRIGHIGTLAGLRTPQPVFSALAELVRSEPELAARLEFWQIGVSDPDYFPISAALSQALNIPVRLLPPISYAQSFAAMREMDVLCVLDAQIRNSVFLPSKLMDYLEAERPIWGVAGKGSLVAHLLQSWNQEWSDIRAPNTILQALRRIAGGQIGTAPPPSVRAAFAPELTGRVLSELIEQTRLAETPDA